MIVLRRTAPFAAAAAFTLAAAPVLFADLESDFAAGVASLRQGNTEEALRTFEALLASGPSNEEVYELWRGTAPEDWLDVLTAGPRFELIGEQLSALADLGRKERRLDEDAIRGLVAKVTSEDPVERRNALLKLGADHGEYAVPYLTRALADSGDEDRRILSMAALSRMSGDILPPLVAALLESEDAYLRRNVAFVLGNRGDARAAGFLTYVAQNDPDSTVREAAAEAADRLGSGGDATLLLLQLGDDFHHRRDSALRSDWMSDVVWTSDGRELVAEELPRFLYNDALAARAYGVALMSDPSSLAAQAGLARAYVSQQAELADHVAADALGSVGDEEALMRRVADLSVKAGAVTEEALDLALQWSVEAGDAVTGAALAAKLAAVGSAKGRGLDMALRSGDGALASEAAVAIGEIAARTGAAADDVVDALGQTVGREIVRIVAVVDANAARANAIAEGLRAEGVLTNVYGSGAAGLATLVRLPGLDAIVVADDLPDVTTDALLRAVRADARFAETPVLLATDDAETAADAWGDRVAGTVSGGDPAPVLASISGNASKDRARADMLSRRAADVLARLAQAGNTNIGAVALANLRTTLGAGRPDEVIVPAMRALAAAGTRDSVPALLAVLGGDGSDEARAAAGHALAGIASRDGGIGGEEAVAALANLMNGDVAESVRAAAATALGRMDLDPARRLELLVGRTGPKQ